MDEDSQHPGHDPRKVVKRTAVFSAHHPLIPKRYVPQWQLDMENRRNIGKVKQTLPLIGKIASQPASILQLFMIAFHRMLSLEMHKMCGKDILVISTVEEVSAVEH